MVADILVELNHVFVDKTFTYIVPDNMINVLQKGMRVKVPFGNQFLEGFVLNIRESNEDIELKEIDSLIDDAPILSTELLELGKYISDMTLSSLMTSYQAMLPKALKAKIKVDMHPAYKTYIELISKDSLKLNDSQKKIVSLLQNDNRVEKSILNKISASSVKTLLNKSVIKEIKEEEYRLKLKDVKKKDFNLYPYQKEAYDEIIKYKDNSEVFLIHGITGSGKTNIYIKLIEEILKSGKTAIVLVPEISLTPQMIERFTSYFDKIAVLHSGLSDGEKYDEWRKINSGDVNIVIGARSAIFAPLNNIGIIIIDEEHSTTYKQENSPRYNTIDVAKFRSKYHNCPIVLGSATPSLESYARAQKGLYHLIELKERANQKDMPKVEIIDMNKEFKKANGFFSKKLLAKINEKLDKDEQVILFLNRRGYSNYLMCSSCGHVETCPKCDISLTYHKTSNMLRCHYCGYAKKKEDICSKCGNEIISYGIGTEKVEEELHKLVSNAKIIRMDVDTTTKKGSHEKIISDFMSQKYNILLGTQMISKGLDFPNVTLVGVINADLSLNFPDFRSSEYTFQLLNQVSGRSGRGDKEGEVLIQTFNPDHYAILYSKDNDYISFYNEEMVIRKELGYSPYYYLALIRIISSDYDLAGEISNKIADYLRKNVKEETILGPSVANIFKVNNRYRFQIIIKYKKINNVQPLLKEINNHYFGNKKIKVEIDFNPIQM